MLLFSTCFASRKYVFNFPRSVQDMETILDKRFYFDKLIFYGDKKWSGLPKLLIDQYKQIGVQIGDSELYDHFKVN